jgi:hypothetical protein
MAGEQSAQGFGVDPSPVEGRVEAAPAATMRCLEAQVDGRGDGTVRGEDGVGEFEEGVAPAVEAFVERAAEAVESIGRFHDAPIMHSPTALRIPCPTPELKRKLRLELYNPALECHDQGVCPVGDAELVVGTLQPTLDG